MEQQARRLIKNAAIAGVSDIHILPESTGYYIYFRVPAGLKNVVKLSFEAGERLISYFKFSANMNIGERRKPQTGSLDLELDKESMELRISTISNYLYQESMVIRLLYKHNAEEDVLLDVFFQRDYQKLSQLLEYKSGLILFSGPVDSGKTTTIYHLLRKKYAQTPIQVITMEDPVEIKEPRFLQSEVNEQAGIFYETLIKQSLRHHPDILVIGEIRDEETAKMAIRSTLSGHLVIATVHARDCFGVIGRMHELGITLQQMQQTFLGLVSQRLINKYCPLCNGACSIYCDYYSIHHKRAILFELLSGNQLKLAFEKKGGTLYFNGINEKLRKAYACGYISMEDYQKNKLF